MTDNAIIIPTRLEATRLPNKPLKKINGKEMIALTKLTTPKRGPSIKFMLVN